MNGHRFDDAFRTQTTGSRRSMLRLGAGALTVLPIWLSRAEAEAKKRCKHGKKKCQGQCIPKSGCCTDAECPTGSGKTCKDHVCTCPDGQFDSGGVCATPSDCSDFGGMCSAVGGCCSDVCVNESQTCTHPGPGQPCLASSFACNCVGFVCQNG
ncbi:MAG TPA: hypothetical protein VFU81_20195 [Thermomicrobiales bacterium]|nr:hypothetical protein [Thermomicrobiales bacterium]